MWVCSGAGFPRCSGGAPSHAPRTRFPTLRTPAPKSLVAFSSCLHNRGTSTTTFTTTHHPPQLSGIFSVSSTVAEATGISQKLKDAAASDAAGFNAAFKAAGVPLTAAAARVLGAPGAGRNYLLPVSTAGELAWAGGPGVGSGDRCGGRAPASAGRLIGYPPR